LPLLQQTELFDISVHSSLSSSPTVFIIHKFDLTHADVAVKMKFAELLFPFEMTVDDYISNSAKSLSDLTLESLYSSVKGLPHR
jgi:hypothetical protein